MEYNRDFFKIVARFFPFLSRGLKACFTTIITYHSIIDTLPCTLPNLYPKQTSSKFIRDTTEARRKAVATFVVEDKLKYFSTKVTFEIPIFQSENIQNTKTRLIPPN